MQKIKTGIDAPAVPISYGLVGLIFLVEAALTPANYGRIGLIVVGVSFVIGCGLFLRTSLIGKALIWTKLLDEVCVLPTDQALDLGCGHGAILYRVAERLTLPGTVTGVDLWHSRDQSKNSLAATQTNLNRWGVSDRTNLITADMAALPLPPAEYDLVTASLALHNVKPTKRREQALREAVRVLKPGGKLLIVDTGHNRKEYQRVLTAMDCRIVQARGLGIDGWWSGPWMSSYMIWAAKK